MSKEVLSTTIIELGTPFHLDACASLPFSAIKTHLHNERTYPIVKNSPFAKELVKSVTCLTFADFLFTGPTGGRKPKLRRYIESLITLFFSYRCGSVIVDLTLSFSAIVTEKQMLNILQDAAKDGTLGNFNVDASSIKGTRADILVATRPAIGKTTPKPRDGTILSKKCFPLT